MKTIHSVVMDALLRHIKLSSRDSFMRAALRANSSSSPGWRLQQHQQQVANMGTTAKIINMLIRAMKPDSTFMAYKGENINICKPRDFPEFRSDTYI